MKAIDWLAMQILKGLILLANIFIGLGMSSQGLVILRFLIISGLLITSFFLLKDFVFPHINISFK